MNSETKLVEGVAKAESKPKVKSLDSLKEQAIEGKKVLGGVSADYGEGDGQVDEWGNPITTGGSGG